MSADGFILTNGDAHRVKRAVAIIEKVERWEGQHGGDFTFDPLIGGFTGNVYFKGQLFVLTGTALPFVHINASQTGNIVVEYNAGPMVLPWPGFEYWYVVANTYGDIVIN